MTTLGAALPSATCTMAECVEAGCPLPGNLVARAQAGLRHLDVARESLGAHIAGRLAALGVEVERHKARTAPPPGRGTSSEPSITSCARTSQFRARRMRCALRAAVSPESTTASPLTLTVKREA
ncbi:hypothetical protein [Streptomyces leeuwenhoekii]|uniref:hypothetical protein n=1 Tax=Streptomyces leeuwenhoekii TaxID=1437453 RepID=UPI0004947EB2|nr:hypothetical protein [Streptomyces leeuwenhoekii]